MAPDPCTASAPVALRPSRAARADIAALAALAGTTMSSPGAPPRACRCRALALPLPRPMAAQAG